MTGKHKLKAYKYACLSTTENTALALKEKNNKRFTEICFLTYKASLIA